MDALRLFFAAAAIALLCASAPATADVDETYASLRAAQPSGRAVTVENLVLERDVFRFRFSGTFEFLTPVEGESSGAVFTGRGEWTLTPASASERSGLALRMRRDALEMLEDRFERLVLLFTDDTGRQLSEAGKATAPSSMARAAMEDAHRRIRRDFKTNLFLRLAADRLRRVSPSNGVFLAIVDGERLPPAILAFDPWNVESLRLPGELLGGAESALYVQDAQRGGYWYLEHRKEEIARGIGHPPRRLVDANHYEIETTIQRNKTITGTAVIHFESLVPNARVLPLHLLGTLRIEKTELARGGGESWIELPFVQEDRDEDPDSAVILPAGLPVGEVLRLRVRYSGAEVVKEFGRHDFFVGARTNWYPSLDIFEDLATFELTFRVPKAFSVVAVGRPIADRTEGGVRVSVWKADRPIRVAGFNYGEFVKRENADADSGMTIRVFTRKNESPEVWAEGCEADGVNTARVGTVYFGKLDDRTVSITEQLAWQFGQSWPGLIFHPNVSWLDSTIRQELGLRNAAEFVESVGLHEFAHQWWGHRVGWASYRDEWISEGFSEFTAALVLHHTAGASRYQEFWEKARREILGKPPGSELPHDAAGPISMGWRMETQRSPGARFAIIYKKGAYVLQMLRLMMQDSRGGNSDARFIAMMKEFATAQAGKNASTDDFRKVVEKHMTESMNLGGDGTMRWFFDQWVDGTEIPRFRANLTVSPEGDRFRIRGSISQEAVGPQFRVPVPIYAEFGKNELARIGAVPMQGTSVVPVDVAIKLPKTPRRIVVNALHDVLARD